MGINAYHIIAGILMLMGMNILTFTFLYYILGNRDRPKPLILLKNSARLYWMLCSKISKRIFWLDDLTMGDKVQYADWALGLGFGYMDKPLQIGDQILVKQPKDRYYRLVVAWVKNPNPEDNKYFIFKTFYLGCENGTSKEISKLKGFQCYL